MNKLSIKIVFTDLDGTLLNSNRKISQENRNMLSQLKEQSILRVAVTGRNLFSLAQVIKIDDPLDYIIFSTGAGILDWKTEKLIYSKNLQLDEINNVSEILLKQGINFMLHKAVPHNHQFYYYHNGVIAADFQRRLDLYSRFAEKFEHNNLKEASQFLVILEEQKKFAQLKEKMQNVKVVRATSPLDMKSIWMEIFHQEVSKSFGCQWLCDYLGIKQDETVSFGNDYNDEDMLQWTARSFIVGNGVDELKQKYTITNSNDDNGFAEALKKIF